jgi:fructosamine-3-kinase
MLTKIHELLNLIGHTDAHDINVSVVGGGCISNAFHLTFRDSRGQRQELFVKQNRRAFADNFHCELFGLQQLATTDTLKVPCPIGVYELGDAAWLVTQWIESGTRPPDFFERFGADLAKLHYATRGSQIGIGQDNYLGSARQPNQPTDTWLEFVAVNRLGVQIRWATNQGLLDSRLRAEVQRVIDRLDDLLSGRHESTSLIHGDLWSGNYMCDQLGRVVVIDPAIFYGCREAEWGMIELFGGCPASFTAAYHQEYPLRDGWQRRVKVYVLYHLLNHLNLFGRAYADQCQSITASLLR